MAKKTFNRKSFAECEAYETTIKIASGEYFFVQLAPVKSGSKLPLLVANRKSGVVKGIKFTEVLGIIEPPYTYPTGDVTVNKIKRAKPRETFIESKAYLNRKYMFLGMHPNTSLRNNSFIIVGIDAQAGTAPMNINSMSFKNYSFSSNEPSSDEVEIVVDGKITIISRTSAKALNLI